MAEQQKDMSFLEHLEELRRRLFWSIISILVGIILIITYHDFVVDEIIMGPRKADFITYRAFCHWSHRIGMGESLCLDPPQLVLQSTTMSGNMNADITVCVFGGIILAFPFIIWQLWGFIKPGLKEKETKSVRGIVFYVSLLFFTGVAFAYFLLAPLSIQFLGNYTFADVQNTPTLLSYLKLTTTLVFGTGLVFQLPVVIYFLSRIGIVTADFLRKYRRHAFVINLIIAAIITPPDVTSQILVSLPMLLLYEVSILVAARAEKRTAQ